jgi:protein-S-isoprenylcysteine O-methyltransferase
VKAIGAPSDMELEPVMALVGIDRAVGERGSVQPSGSFGTRHFTPTAPRRAEMCSLAFMNMHMNIASVLGMLYGASEIVLTIVKRHGQRDKAADAGSLGLIWIVVGASIGAAFYVANAFPGGAFPNVALAQIVGLAIFIPGAVLRWYAIFYLGRYFTVDVRVAEDQRVVDTGPYRFIRHPSYTGAFMQFFGFALSIGNAWSVLVVMAPVLVAFSYRIRVEERALEQGLGEAYASYRRRTKRLIPFVH